MTGITGTGILNNNTISFSFSQNIGRLYENVIFNDLLRREKEIFFLNQHECECDFIIKEGTIITGAYQVCYELNVQNMVREKKGSLWHVKNST
jgi:hypothetical protein